MCHCIFPFHRKKATVIYPLDFSPRPTFFVTIMSSPGLPIPWVHHIHITFSSSHNSKIANISIISNQALCLYWQRSVIQTTSALNMIFNNNALSQSFSSNCAIDWATLDLLLIKSKEYERNVVLWILSIWKSSTTYQILVIQGQHTALKSWNSLKKQLSGKKLSINLGIY